MLKEIVTLALRKAAKKQLAQFQPIVVAVTGSVGKTSTKNAVAIALEAKYSVRKAEKNYNNEIGVPLAILGEPSPGKDAWEWIKLLKRAKGVKSFPKYLVLEYGADKPGDIAALCQLATPAVGVITAVSPVHAANYPNFAALAEEKATLGDHVPEHGLVVINTDDPTVALMKDRFEAPVISYGLQDANVTASDIRIETRIDDSFDPDEVFAITRATVNANGETAELALKNCLGTMPVSASLAAIAVARHAKIPVVKSVEALNAHFEPAPGRMRPVPGVKGALILDDTYNAAPASVMAALETLAAFETVEHKRKIVALGTMAELGQYSEAEHRNIGKKVASVADLFIAVGPDMKFSADEAARAGMDADAIEWLTDSVEAGRYLDRMIKKGDIVLVKGSQSARMERAVKDIMADPLRAKDFLCRQDEKWLN